MQSDELFLFVGHLIVHAFFTVAGRSTSVTNVKLIFSQVLVMRVSNK